MAWFDADLGHQSRIPRAFISSAKPRKLIVYGVFCFFLVPLSSAESFFLLLVLLLVFSLNRNAQAGLVVILWLAVWLMIYRKPRHHTGGACGASLAFRLAIAHQKPQHHTGGTCEKKSPVFWSDIDGLLMQAYHAYARAHLRGKK